MNTINHPNVTWSVLVGLSVGILLSCVLSGCASTASEMRGLREEEWARARRAAVLLDCLGRPVSDARLRACARGDQVACGRDCRGRD